MTLPKLSRSRELAAKVIFAALQILKEKGGEMIPQSPEESAKWQKAITPVFDEYIKTVSGKGIDGKAVVDFIKANL